jgi:dethiobiotin synthetase
MNIIVAGIHTGIGKTLCSAIICQALGYNYWKPVQAGALDNSDSIIVSNLVTHPHCLIQPEQFKLVMAASPHYAAQAEGKEIKPADFVIPESKHPMVIETAGGLMSPLAKNYLNIHLIQALRFPVVLVSNNYLGSINHTLLSVTMLEQNKIPIKGLVFCGYPQPSSESFILRHTKLPLLFSIPFFETVDSHTIAEFAKTIELKF